MVENKLKNISNLFEGYEIRSIWVSEKEDYYFSVVDVVEALIESKRPRKYWNFKNKIERRRKSVVRKNRTTENAI